jgi:acetate kinase
LGAILVVNAGSRSLKLHVVDDDDRADAVADLASVSADRLDGVGHRVVHGGPALREPVVVDRDVEAAIRQATSIAPLHNAPALDGLERAQERFPHVPHVAVFDTAFHADMPEVAATYAVPSQWRETWGIRRYGFHGLSVQWASEQVVARRLIVCHLGGGCSVTAVLDGRSVDTTMGFSPLEGVPMATRSGSVDPGALVYLLREQGLAPAELDDALERSSGLVGLSGATGDVRELIRLEAQGHDAAHQALSVFTYRVATAVGAMAAALDGVDALVFTAGVGEGSPGIRERICDRLGFLGIELDHEANAVAVPDAEVASARSSTRVVVLRAREELIAARAVRQLVSRRVAPVVGSGS